MNPREHRLRVLQVASGMPNWGGAELHLIHLAEELNRRDHEVTILCRPESFVAREAGERGIPTLSGVVRSQSDFGAYHRLLPLMREGRYDVMHVHMFPDHIVPPLAARMAKVPVVVMTHHLPFPLKKGLWKRYLIRQALFNRAIGVSDSVRRLLMQSGISEEKAVTIYHGTDVAAFQSGLRDPDAVRAEWGVAPEQFLVGMVGRLTREKGVDVFIEAMSLLKAKEELHGVLIGDGEMKAELTESIRQKGLQDRIHFAGFRKDVNNAINALDVHVLASTWAEPCAAVVQQAMALGKPVVGTDIGGTPEMIIDGQTGVLIPPGEPAALAAALQRLLVDPESGRTMGQAGRERCERLFTLQHMVDRIEELYWDELARVRKPR